MPRRDHVEGQKVNRWKISLGVCCFSGRLICCDYLGEEFFSRRIERYGKKKKKKRNTRAADRRGTALDSFSFFYRFVLPLFFLFFPKRETVSPRLAVSRYEGKMKRSVLGRVLSSIAYRFFARTPGHIVASAKINEINAENHRRQDRSRENERGCRAIRNPFRSRRSLQQKRREEGKKRSPFDRESLIVVQKIP